MSSRPSATSACRCPPRCSRTRATRDRGSSALASTVGAATSPSRQKPAVAGLCGDLGLTGYVRRHGMPAPLGVFTGKAGCSAVTEPVRPENGRAAESGMSVGDGPEADLWNFVGAPKVFGGSRSWSLRDFGTQALGGDSRLSPRGWRAVDRRAAGSVRGAPGLPGGSQRPTRALSAKLS
jgi:hypothetical protein